MKLPKYTKSQNKSKAKNVQPNPSLHITSIIVNKMIELKLYCETSPIITE